MSELESKLEQTKEGQIAAWQSRSLRRMLNYSLAKGWGAWHELYETRRYQTRLIQVARGKFFHITPTMKGAFYYWVNLCEDAKQAKVEAKALTASNLTTTVKTLREQLEGRAASV